jgi:hypothetical protein
MQAQGLHCTQLVLYSTVQCTVSNAKKILPHFKTKHSHLAHSVPNAASPGTKAN